MFRCSISRVKSISLPLEYEIVKAKAKVMNEIYETTAAKNWYLDTLFHFPSEFKLALFELKF